jgi:methionyl-tRNA formyltransferase
MKKFVLFVNNGTGIELLKLLLKNGIYPDLVLTQTPYDLFVVENSTKKLFNNIKYLISRIIHQKIYLELYDVYFFCKKNKIEVISERYTNHSILTKRCKQLNINQGIIFTFGKIIKKNIIDSFSEGIINFHPSLLPRHRGTDPFFWTIFNEEEYSGITFHFIDEKIDKGVILFQKQYRIIDNESVASLSKILIQMGGDEVLYYLRNGKFRESDLHIINEKIVETYETIPKKEFFCISESTSSDNIRKLFKAVFLTLKPYIQLDKEIIEFSNYENTTDNYEIVSDKTFIICKSDNYFTIRTSDNKIIKLYK